MSGQLTHPAVMDLMAKAVQRCKALGMPVGTIGGEPGVGGAVPRGRLRLRGGGSDLGLLMQGARSAIAALRTPGGEHVHSISSGHAGRLLSMRPGAGSRAPDEA